MPPFLLLHNDDATLLCRCGSENASFFRTSWDRISMIGAQHKWLLWSQNVYLVVLSMSICHMMLPWGAILPRTGNSEQALQQKWMNHKIMIHTVHTVAILSENENVCTTCTTSQMYRKPVLLFSVCFCLLDRLYCFKIFIWTLFLKYLLSGATAPFSRELHMTHSRII